MKIPNSMRGNVWNLCYYAACVLAFIAVPLGTFVTIKTINKLSRPPVNTLVRSGDIELADYIEPTQPFNTFYPNQFDLVRNQFSVLERVSYPPTYYSGSNPPFYRSGTLPYYQSVDGININCCLEENINLDLILWLILFFILVILIRKVLISNINKIIILLVLFLATIYIQFGLLVLTQIIILFKIVILSNLLLGLNPYNKWLHIIKITSIILTISILYYNSRDILISSAFMTPLSISRISYMNDLDIPSFTEFWISKNRNI